MSVIKPPITKDQEVDSWSYNTTQRLDDIDSILAGFFLKTWTLNEDENGKLTFSKDGEVKMRLSSNGNLEIAGTLTSSVTF
jgi:hypothetical protein